MVTEGDALPLPGRGNVWDCPTTANDDGAGDCVRAGPIVVVVLLPLPPRPATPPVMVTETGLWILLPVDSFAIAFSSSTTRRGSVGNGLGKEREL